MAEGLFATNFDELAASYLDDAPAGTIALHAMLGIHYPTDEAQSKRQLDANVAAYARRVAAYTAAGIVVQRLVLGPAGYKYDSSYWRRMRKILEPVVAAGEEVRMTDLALHENNLKDMAVHSWFARHHQIGMNTQTPQCSFWALEIPGEDEQSSRHLTWVMSYDREPDGTITFLGGPIYDATAEPQNATEWREYWRAVFESSPRLLPKP